MTASCRNGHAVVTECAADYHSRMQTVAGNVYRLIESAGPGRRVQFRRNSGDGADLVVVAGYRGAEPPETLTEARVEALGTDSWRLSSREGSVEFTARAVDAIEVRPGLFRELHRPFALSAPDRLAARVLLALLRLPGGARLLRRWHANRTA
jgi:hypothetical protein